MSTAEITAKPGKRQYGSGQLYVPNGTQTYYGRWRINGKRVNRAIGPVRTRGRADGMTKAEAERKLAAMIAESVDTAAREAAPVRRDYTLGDAARDYVRSRERAGRKDTTTTDYDSALRTHVLPFFGADTPVAAIDRAKVRDFIEHLTNTPSERTGKPLSAKSIRNYVGVLTYVLNYAVREERLSRNPADGIELPTATADDLDESPIRAMTLAQVRALVAAVPEGTDYTTLDRSLYLTAAQSGLRQGELRGLRWSAVDFTARTITVSRALVRDRVTTPKSRKARIVPMTEDVADALAVWRSESVFIDPDDPVFADPMTGRAIARTPMMERYGTALTRAGLAGFRFHDLRHTYCSLLAAAGVPATDIQAWAGHADVRTTMRYIHAFAPKHEQAAVATAAFAAGPKAVQSRSNLTVVGVPEDTSAQQTAA